MQLFKMPTRRDAERWGASALTAISIATPFLSFIGAPANAAEAPASSPVKVTQVNPGTEAKQSDFNWRESEDVKRLGTPRLRKALEDMEKLQKLIAPTRLKAGFESIKLFNISDYGKQHAQKPWDVRTLEQMKIAITTGAQIGPAYASEKDNIYSKSIGYREFAVDCMVIVIGGKEQQARQVFAALAEDFIRFRFALTQPNYSDNWFTQAYNNLPEDEAWKWSVNSTIGKYEHFVRDGYDGAVRQKMAERIVSNLNEVSVTEVIAGYRANKTFTSDLRASILEEAQARLDLSAKASKTPKVAMGL